jgi:hypothetical protein
VNDDIEKHYKPVRAADKPVIDLHQLALQVHAAHAELRRAEAAVEELMRKYKEEQDRTYDAADTTLANLLAMSTNLWAVTKTVCDDEELHEFVIPLAVFKSKKKAEAACLTFAEARAHHDSEVFEVRPLPFFRKGGAA